MVAAALGISPWYLVLIRMESARNGSDRLKKNEDIPAYLPSLNRDNALQWKNQLRCRVLGRIEKSGL